MRRAWCVLGILLALAGCQCARCGGPGANTDAGNGNGSGNGSDGGDDGGTVDAGPVSGNSTGNFTTDGGSGGGGEGITLDPNGNVVLSSGSTEFHYMWIANDSNGWVSKYDTMTGKEVARYWSVIPKDCSNSPGPP